MIPGMPRPRPPHLHREANRHGKVVWYVRVGKGARVRIRDTYGTPEFEEAYQAAIQGDRPRGAAKATRGTLGGCSISTGRPPPGPISHDQPATSARRS